MTPTTPPKTERLLTSTLQCKLSPQLLKGLQKRCKLLGVSQSEWVRHLITSDLERAATQPTETV